MRKFNWPKSSFNIDVVSLLVADIQISLDEFIDLLYKFALNVDVSNVLGKIFQLSIVQLLFLI